MSVKPIETNYLISYRKYNGKWHLDYTQLELKVKTKSNKWFINPVFTTVSQMVVTSIDTSNSSRFKYKDIVKSDDIIEEIVGYDDNYWDGYNIIQAEEPIIKAIQRISEKPN